MNGFVWSGLICAAAALGLGVWSARMGREVTGDFDFGFAIPGLGAAIFIVVAILLAVTGFLVR